MSGREKQCLRHRGATLQLCSKKHFMQPCFDYKNCTWHQEVPEWEIILLTKYLYFFNQIMKCILILWQQTVLFTTKQSFVFPNFSKIKTVSLLCWISTNHKLWIRFCTFKLCSRSKLNYVWHLRHCKPLKTCNSAKRDQTLQLFNVVSLQNSMSDDFNHKAGFELHQWKQLCP